MNMEKKQLTKNILIYVCIALVLLVLAYAFVPQVLTGKIVNQSDIVGYRGMAQETNAWNAAHPEDPTYWTGAQFSGMPTVAFSSSSKGDWTQKINDFLLIGKRPATWLFLSLLGGFLLMLSLGVDKFLAIGGAIAITFCSYNLQIIQVGHNTKMQALAFMPWVLAAVIFTYKSSIKGKGWKEWLPQTVLGAALFAFALSLQIKANHQQITYYLAIMIFIMAIGLFIWMACTKSLRPLLGRFFAASALLLVIGCIGIATNTIKLAPLYEYTQYTMRGGTELSNPTGQDVNKDGLQLDYATAWSYGWNELPNMLIPDFNGGSSAGSIDPDKSAVAKLFNDAGQNGSEVAKSLPLYWGPQPFTAGPMYMGAITIFLFLLGLFLYKGKEKWILLAITIFAILLSLGSHFMSFTKFCFNTLPMYNKFRTVSMALIILQFTLPMLGFVVLDRILKNEYSKEEFKKSSLIALILTAGFCVVMMIIPSLAGSFSGSSDSQMQGVIVDALKQDRKHLLVNDAMWSAIFILLAYFILLWFYHGSASKDSSAKRGLYAGLAISALVLINMFSVGKRYLNSDDFVYPRQFESQLSARAVDKAILEDKSPSYRVADISRNLFNDSFVSYWHKNIGGYSPAKIQRYQDLIDKYITPEITSFITKVRLAKTVDDAKTSFQDMPILNALNTKYFIVGADVPLVNPNAMGNAWFVTSGLQVGSPDEEIESIGKVDLAQTAVVGNDFADAFAEAQKTFVQVPGLPVQDTIYMVSYAPNELHYHYKASSDRTAIFSEVYYPKGWHAWLADKSNGADKPIELFRADWILRGAVLPAGEHELVMRYDPKVYPISENVSRASSITLIILLILSVGGMFVPKKKEE
jgi:hypothetical protein